jgi:hypothetical protein
LNDGVSLSLVVLSHDLRRVQIVWAEVPNELKPVYRWFNIPASPLALNGDNPLTHLRSQARKEDYVIFKLDIDNNYVEEQIVEQLLASPELLALIDDFYWEHHVNFQPMTSLWELYPDDPKRMNHSLNLFTALRQAGVRAHSWT